jgi:chromate reductase
LLSKALIRLAPPELQMTEIPYKDLPLYNRDHDADYPLVAREFKNAITAVDAVLFVTPEYNRSIPGALKNAIDWASHCPSPQPSRDAADAFRAAATNVIALKRRDT